jgi:hypothetical protein
LNTHTSDLIEEYTTENNILDKELIMLKHSITSLKNKQKLVIKKLDDLIDSKIKKEIPKVDIIIDLIKEELSNLVNNFETKNKLMLTDKIKKLIENIIS